VEVAQMQKDLDAIRGAVATIEALRQSDMQRQMLTGAKAKYDVELRRTTEAQARCERLVREESPGSTPSPAPGVAAAAPAGPTPAVPAPVAAVPEASPTPATPCLTGCGKDTDCKRDRICVKGACQDPPSR
jgi:hypothetical protein